MVIEICIKYLGDQSSYVCMYISGLDPRSTPFLPTRYIYRTEIKPGKYSETRIKPLPLVSNHGRYNITVTPERTPVSVETAERRLKI